MTTTETATVEVLTAEVRVLQVGRRQITLSVYRQLDEVDAYCIEPFGRVNDGSSSIDPHVVGRGLGSGALVRSRAQRFTRTDDLAREWAELPLIVLAGLR